MECRKCGAPLDEQTARRAGRFYNKICTPCYKAYQRAHYHKNRDAYIRRTKFRKGAIKETVMAAYGGKCVCCGERELAFLELDHVTRDHSVTPYRSGQPMYNWIFARGCPVIAELQILCRNCNFAKYSQGECPHVTKKKAFN